MNHKLLALYGLKFNPFSPELPTAALYVPTRIEQFQVSFFHMLRLIIMLLWPALLFHPAMASLALAPLLCQ